MNQIHKNTAKIEYDLVVDMTKAKNLEAGTIFINSMVNEGLWLVHDQKIEQIVQYVEMQKLPIQLVI